MTGKSPQPKHRAPASDPPLGVSATHVNSLRLGEPRDDVAEIIQGLRRMVRAISIYSQEVYRHYGLTGPQLWALKTLQRLGPISVGQLAQSLAVHQSSMSVLVDRRETRGLVRRVRARPDRRFVRVELTARGEKLVAGAPEAAQGRLLHALRGMAPTEVRRLRRGVGRLVEAMEATDVEAPFFFSDE